MFSFVFFFFNQENVYLKALLAINNLQDKTNYSIFKYIYKLTKKIIDNIFIFKKLIKKKPLVINFEKCSKII